jgi:hypothetical protein
MADVTNMVADPNTAQEDAVIKEEVNTQIHKHLSTVFVVVGIISFTLGAIVNWYTIQRLRGGKI